MSESSVPEYLPLEGKTYSLFGNSISTADYFETIKLLTDKIVEISQGIDPALSLLYHYSSKKSFLRRLLKRGYSGTKISEIVHLTDQSLRKFTEKTPKHLESLQVNDIFDPRIGTSREQYHLYMIEIELTNRLFSDDFKKADRKIALTPYCLQDFSVSCKSETMGFDFQCSHCSKNCYQNRAANIMEKYDIDPYIWTTGDMKRLAKYTYKNKQTFAVLGIACVPELVWGMRKCRKNNIPVVGLPLNANRCRRWFGEFLPNSIDLDELDKLVAS